jgi:hypothetical protein
MNEPSNPLAGMAAPSPEYTAAKAALDAAEREFKETQKRALDRGVYPSDDADFKRACKRLDAALAALQATPDQQYLEEVTKAEHEAADRFLDGVLLERGRQTAVLSISQYPTTDEALDHTGLASRMVEQRYAESISVVADMRRLNAAQLVRSLRWLADQVESGGVSVYHGQTPIAGWLPDWWADEFPDGHIRHHFYQRPEGVE